MSRYTIAVTSDDHTDPDATIGYDPPLRTFFLQAFRDETGDDLALWLGTSDREAARGRRVAARCRLRSGSRTPAP